MQKNTPNSPMDIKFCEGKIIYEMSQHFNISQEEAANKISIWKKLDFESRRL